MVDGPACEIFFLARLAGDAFTGGVDAMLLTVTN